MRHLIAGCFLLALLLRQSPLLATTPILLERCGSLSAGEGGERGHEATYILEAEIDKIYAFADDTVKQRLAQLDQSIVEHRFDPAVRRLIGMYVERYRSGSERLLARSVAYFPFFSKRLVARGMPDALKYLTIPESALRPYALSQVGAAGFWQLMPGTAREQGLVVSDTLDERLDLVLGTEAGLNYLQTQYERYEDWALAMAAYNCGPGRVNRAKRRSGSSDYWRLRKYLPRETRNYVPGYIAAAYLFTYFSAYELIPAKVDPDKQLIGQITVYDFISLHRVAQVTGLNPATVIELNPAYLSGYIPASRKGRTLRIPKRTTDAMQAYLNHHHRPDEEPVLPWLSPALHRGVVNGEAFHQRYVTYPNSLDTSAQQMANWLGQDPHQLLIWSAYGPLDSLTTEQPWSYWGVKNYLTFGEKQRMTTNEVARLPKYPYRLPDRQEIPPRIIPNTAVARPQTKVSSLNRLFSDIWDWFKA